LAILSKENEDGRVYNKNQWIKVISTKISVDQLESFNLLAECMFKDGLIDKPTPSSILRNSIGLDKSKEGDNFFAAWLACICCHRGVGKGIPTLSKQFISSACTCSVTPRDVSLSLKTSNGTGSFLRSKQGSSKLRITVLKNPFIWPGVRNFLKHSSQVLGVGIGVLLLSVV
jgi:hypothetical protein